MHALARRNIELTRETFEGLSALMRDLAQPVSAEDRIAKNTEYAKKLIEKGVNHGREVATIAAKAGTDAAEILHRRATEGLDEFRSFASQQTQARADNPPEVGRPPLGDERRPFCLYPVSSRPTIVLGSLNRAATAPRWPARSGGSGPAGRVRPGCRRASAGPRCSIAGRPPP